MNGMSTRHKRAASIILVALLLAFAGVLASCAPAEKGDAEGDLPASFDLRDVDGRCYVTPVKLQNPFGAC